MGMDFSELEKGIDRELQPILPSKVTRGIAVKKLLAVVGAEVNEPACPATKLTFWDKAWDGTKHFIYGFVLAGGGAIAVSRAPLYLLAAGVIGGVVEASRKVAKNNLKEQGKDYADVLDKLLTIVLELIKAWREKKSKKN
jgi:hypothetical protein